ncbi:hypothetical protein MOVS_00320 [Moraxella ovis]|uniref:Uncharacterized protein n=1 Tax=Moraxella ovis TaxID=29433 RepID=A0A378PH18_9GAMM|nr:hypothetical protein [Moraxella ovis]ANB90707.1 hypothetical protein MOVS_00320 [Moraxella ovis]STY86104.1 Uncharacterised protein [Moraxella ovis]
MKKLSILALTATIATAPAFAETTVYQTIPSTTPSVELSTQPIQATDLSFAFDDTQNLQAVAMTDSQMQETEGARFPKFITNIRVDGPDKGFRQHYNGRIFQIRYGSTPKTRTPVFRLDHHDNPSPAKLHMHIAPDIHAHRPWNAPWKRF